jgi:hypothetical protein
MIHDECKQAAELFMVALSAFIIVVVVVLFHLQKKPKKKFITFSMLP